MGFVHLSPEKLREVLQLGTVDTRAGNVFGVPERERREVNFSKLTLVIGIGGSGIEALKQAYETAKVKLKKDHSEYVKFLAVDGWNSYTLKKLAYENVDTINLYNPGIVERLQPENRSFFYKKWIPREFPNHEYEYGSGSSRLAKRVMLYDDNGEISNDQILYNTIKGYFEGDWADKKNLSIDIMVLTGISGSTGSGTFIDIAAIAKRACPDPSRVTVYGYIMLPDTVEKWAWSDDKKRIFHRNAYAALKELESYESLDMELNPHREMIHTRAFDIEFSEFNKPFDYPVLISGDYDEAISMIRDLVVNLIADANKGRYSTDQFEQRFLFGNIGFARYWRMESRTVSTGGVLNTGAHPEDSHMYDGIGYAHASIPEKIVIPHLIGAVSKKLYVQFTPNAFCTKDKPLSIGEFRKAMALLLQLKENEILDGDSLWRHILRQLSISCRVKDNSVDITYYEVVDGQISEYLKGFNTVAATNDAKEVMSKYVRDALVLIEEKAKDIMKQYGPRAILYLWDGTGNYGENGKREDYSEFSLKTQIKTVSDGLRELTKIEGKMPPLLEYIAFIMGLSQEKKNEYLREWCEDTRRAINTNVRCDVCKAMTGTDGVWESEFVKPFTEFLNRVEWFAEVLEGISDFYSEEGKSLDSDDYREFAEKGGEINGINLCTDASMYQWVQSEIECKLNTINTQNVRDELIDDFFNHTDLWTSNEEGKARKAYDEVMSRVCGIGKYEDRDNRMNLSIQDYFEHVLEEVPETNQQNVVNNTVKAIYESLLAKSAPSLILKPQTSEEINITIMLPKALEASLTGAMIKNAFDRLLRQGNGNVQLAYSSVVDAIVCYQTSVANAMCDINDLDTWEKHYYLERVNTTHRDNGEFSSLHVTEDKGYSQYNELTQAKTAFEARMSISSEVLPDLAGTALEREVNRIYGTGLSWAHYPSLNITRYGDDFSNRAGTEESKYRSDIFTKRVKEAIRIGLIEWEQVGNTYKCFLNTIPKDWTNLNVKEYNLKKNEKYVRGKVLFEYLKNQNPNGSSEYRKQIALKNPSFFGTQGFDFSANMDKEEWTEDKAAATREAYMMRILRKSTGLYQDMLDTMIRFYGVELEMEKGEEAKLKLKAYKNFVEWFLIGVIETDVEQYEWDLVTTTYGYKEEIITFGKKFLVKMSADDKAFYKAGLKLPLVYRAFKDKQFELELSDRDLNDVKESIIDRLSEKDYDRLIDARIEVLKAERYIYKGIVGKSKDAVIALVEHFNVDDDLIDEYEEVVNFYEVFDELIQEYI